MVTTLDNLSFAADLVTGQTIYNFSKLTNLATPISRPSLTYKVPGVHGGYNPLGYDPNWLDPATIKIKYLHYYIAGETYWSVKDDIWKRLGNRPVFLYIVESDGVTTKRNIGSLTQRPNEETADKMLSAVEFELEFALASPFWKDLPQPGVLFYDTNQRYDTGLAYDQGGQAVLLTGGGPWQIGITNKGNAPEYEARIILIGPFAGPITVANINAPLPSGYLQFTYAPSPDLATGEVAIIDCGLGWVIRGGATDFGHFSWGIAGSGQREWFRIDPDNPLAPNGLNTIDISHPGGAVGGSAQVIARSSWVV